MTTSTYHVTGMTCGHCESSIREEVVKVAGIETLTVSAKTGTLTVTSPTGADDAAVIAAVVEAGYWAVRAR
ncbi:heavy-metal-associated domain-containing protein [Paenarthrobacter sp. NPDC018779]|uniref:heavy-metal-associated domain-containing protein n=1 Tax=Paenarthrobacter sp. NPDC018779 TaxID=3364375 RepID=UPI0037C55F61